MTTERKKPKVYKGVVAGVSGNKTIKVTLEYQTSHPKYGKMLKRRTNAHVHDENNTAIVGNTVEICKCRPMSKTKTWRLVQVLDTNA
ncbi:MAG: 30S ribosomal protein S17 [Phycisphaerae bacterium]|nr:30S ribosomal protein S17 [Phycisphaerae bacterium]